MAAARSICWGVFFALFVCGCARVGEHAAAAAPPATEEVEPALSGPSTVGRVWGYQPHRRIRGRVTGVDQGLGLVVLNVGERHGVRERYAFVVYRDEAYIGRVVVSQVFPDYAALRYSPSMRADVEVGDEAATRLAIDF